MEESRKVYGWLVRGRNAAVGCSSMWADIMGGECYCGNLLRQSSLTLLFAGSGMSDADWKIEKVPVGFFTDADRSESPVHY